MTVLSKKTIVISILVLAGLSFGGYTYYKNHQNNKPDDGINYNPPTKQEKKETEDFKKKLIDEQNAKNQNTKTDSSGKKVVTPQIVSYGQTNTAVEVSARVPGIFEDSGTCTLTLTKGSVTVTQNKQASPNVSEMSCGFISISRSKLSSGSWSAKVTYTSSKAHGASEPKVIAVK